MRYLIIALMMSGCTIVDEELIVASGLVTVKVENSKPKVRLMTGIDECKWRARGNIQEGEYEALFLCSIDTDRFKY